MEKFKIGDKVNFVVERSLLSGVITKFYKNTYNEEECSIKTEIKTFSHILLQRVSKINNEDDLIKKIAYLEEQLSNAIVPKFKIGQEVYAIFDKTCWGERMIEVVNAKIIGIIATNKIQYMFSNLADWYIEENVFASKEEAIAKLEDLKNE
jgi:predicted site-specific integrase-resolvase